MTLPLYTESRTVGNGVTTSFPYGFWIDAAGNLDVYLENISTGDLTLLASNQYSVSGVDNPSGGAVTYPLIGSPISSSYAIVIRSSVPLTQEVDISNQGGGWNPDTLEDALDRIVRMIQQVSADRIEAATTFAWADITGKPSVFTPASHTHPSTEISDFTEAVQDVVGAQLVAGSNIILSYNDAAGTLTITSTAGGGGSAAWGSISGTLSNQTDLNTALAGKSATGHTHTASNVTDFNEAVDDRVAALLVAGSNITLTYNDGANTLTVAAAAAASGIVKLVENASIGTGTEYVIDSSIITQAYKRIDLVFDAVSFNTGTSSIGLSISGNNGTGWTALQAAVNSGTAANSYDIVISIYSADLSTGSRLVTIISSNGEQLIAKGNVTTGYINAIKLAADGVKIFDGGTCTAYGYL